MSRPEPTTRSDFSLFRPLQSRWADNDMYGHMNNVTHYLLFDTAINGWLMETGLLDPLKGNPIGLVVETSCRYHGEAGFPDAITAGIGIERLGSSSVAYKIGLFRNDDTSAFADGRFVHVYVDRESRKPVPVPAEWREKLERLS